MILVSHDEGASKLGRAIAYILSLAPDSAAGTEQVPEVPPAASSASDSEQVTETPPSTVA
jgi:hypothetical protein